VIICITTGLLAAGQSDSAQAPSSPSANAQQLRLDSGAARIPCGYFYYLPWQQKAQPAPAAPADADSDRRPKSLTNLGAHEHDHGRASAAADDSKRPQSMVSLPTHQQQQQLSQHTEHKSVTRDAKVCVRAVAIVNADHSECDHCVVHL